MHKHLILNWFKYAKSLKNKKYYKLLFIRSLYEYLLRLATLSALVVFDCGNTSAQALVEKTPEEGIKSVLFHREGWALTYPVMELNGKDRLVLEFDELSNEVTDYAYRIIHCDAHWARSSIPEGDYLDGFYDNRIGDYALSFNTYCNYVHYRLTIPNEDLSVKVSGNYVVEVYKDFDPDSLVLTRRFVVAETVAGVRAQVVRPVMGIFRDNGQQVNVSIDFNGFPVDDPYSELNLAICQNNRWDLSVRDLKPLFVGSGSISYDYQQENVFPGGNEYRHFDIRSIRYQTAEIAEISYEAPYYNIYLYPDEVREGRRYFYQEDLDGRYSVEIQEGSKDEVEADYVYVHFTLPYDVPLLDGDVYVFGSFTNWAAGEVNKMKYNFDRKVYEATLFVKQGYYDYEYVFLNRESGYRDAHFMEGSHYETENNYVVYFYYTDRVKRYDRVIGYQIVNSVRP